MRAFITGLDGFAGQWLARELMSAGDVVAGGSRVVEPAYSILTPAEAAELPWFPFELTDESALAAALSAWRPDVVYHLAAQASVAASHHDPTEAFSANSTGTALAMAAAAKAAPTAAILYVGSAEAYGSVAPAELPIRESTPMRPNNPYARSKAEGEAIALRHGRDSGTRVVATRSFNHIGPGQRTSFAVSSFAEQLADIARGRVRPVVEVGNLEARRDYTDVRDVARAYRLLANSGKAGEAYNVCCGIAVSMQEILETLIAISGVGVEIRVDPARLRPVDTPVSVGDPSKLREATGWHPTIALARSLEDLYRWHLSR